MSGVNRRLTKEKKAISNVDKPQLSVTQLAGGWYYTCEMVAREIKSKKSVLKVI